MVDPRKISDFLNGKDSQQRISNVECGYRDKVAKVYSRDDTNRVICEEIDLYPFVWATEKISKLLFNGNRGELRTQMQNIGIDCKGLQTKDTKGFEHERMANGYRILFFAKKPMSYTTFQKFFETALQWDKKASLFYSDIDGKRQFLSVSPIEMFLIHTSKRFFKGYDDYDDLLRLTWDIETTGLNPEYCQITQIGIRTNHGFEKIIHVNEKVSELKAIEYFLYYIGKLRPDTIAGHNSENFDWAFILKRCEILSDYFDWDQWVSSAKHIANLREKIEFINKRQGGLYSDKNWLGKMSVFYTGETIYKKTKQQVLKLGGEMEYYFPTVFPGHTIIDSLHAVRRAQAIDSNFKSGSLKYAAEYAKVKRKNRVYIPGNKISELYNDKEYHYILNDDNGEWCFEENYVKKEEHTNIKKVNGEYLSDRYLLDDLYEGDRVEYTYNSPNFFLCKLLPITYQKATTMGTSAGWKFMLLAYSYENNIAIPLTDRLYKFTGGLSRLWKVGFVKDVVKYDFNSLYPAITLTWGIFPGLDITGVFEALLDFILSERERYKGLKKEASKKLKNLKNENASESEIKDVEDEIKKWETLENKYDKLQLPFKIFGNGFFGSYGAANIFNWGSVPHAEQITCTGRMSFRLLVKWMMDRKFEPIVGDTDGVNFGYNHVDQDYVYVEKGLNRNTKEGVERKGIHAYCAEFNDLFMRKKMGLGLDEIVPASIYFSRKNYADLLDNGKIKLVGNSIKSKKMPKFIEKFIDTNLPLLLQENGQQFVQNYYDYITKIFNRKIPLKDIASIGRIKVSLQQYKEALKTKTKSGGDKARQAWYELAIKENMSVNAGDTIYYINTGQKNNTGDVVKTPIYEYDKDGKEMRVDKVDKNGNVIYGKKGVPLTAKKISHYEYELNCIRIDEKILENDVEYYGNEDVFGENPIIYNIPKYIDQFNKRISGLLTCFHPDIRNKMLITDPKDINYFDKNETQLVSSMPKKEIDQDSLEELFTMEDKEIKFWMSVPDVVDNLPGKCPPFLDTPELNEVMGDWETIKTEYTKRQEILKQEGIKNEVELYQKILSSDVVGEKTIAEKLLEHFDLRNGGFYSKTYDVKIGSLSDVLEESDKYHLENEDEDIAEYNVSKKLFTEEELFPF